MAAIWKAGVDVGMPTVMGVSRYPSRSRRRRAYGICPEDRACSKTARESPSIWTIRRRRRPAAGGGPSRSRRTSRSIARWALRHRSAKVIGDGPADPSPLPGAYRRWQQRPRRPVGRARVSGTRPKALAGGEDERRLLHGVAVDAGGGHLGPDGQGRHRRDHARQHRDDDADERGVRPHPSRPAAPVRAKPRRAPSQAPRQPNPSGLIGLLETPAYTTPNSQRMTIRNTGTPSM